MKNQGAQDIGKYDYLKDIERIENFSKIKPTFDYGIALIITSDPSYWKKNKVGSVDESFYLTQELIKNGIMKWANHASKGTTKSREKPIELKNKYKIVG